MDAETIPVEVDDSRECPGCGRRLRPNHRGVNRVETVGEGSIRDGAVRMDTRRVLTTWHKSCDADAEGDYVEAFGHPSPIA